MHFQHMLHVISNPYPWRQLLVTSAAVKPNATSAFLQLGRATDPATKAAILSVFKRLALDFAQEAMHKGQFPLQYKAGKAAEPVLQRLLSAALWCNSQDLLEAGVLLLTSCVKGS